MIIKNDLRLRGCSLFGMSLTSSGVSMALVAPVMTSMALWWPSCWPLRMAESRMMTTMVTTLLLLMWHRWHRQHSRMKRHRLLPQFQSKLLTNLLIRFRCHLFLQPQKRSSLSPNGGLRTILRLMMRSDLLRLMLLPWSPSTLTLCLWRSPTWRSQLWLARPLTPKTMRALPRRMVSQAQQLLMWAKPPLALLMGCPQAQRPPRTL